MSESIVMFEGIALRVGAVVEDGELCIEYVRFPNGSDVDTYFNESTMKHIEKLAKDKRDESLVEASIERHGRRRDLRGDYRDYMKWVG